ncbi:MAG: tetratricopeptide repeat protein [Rhodanobacteraceae bacterium]|nr:tetratricopeptide repeat protein [Rhodanobacteraceae bacterium]
MLLRIAVALLLLSWLPLLQADTSPIANSEPAEVAALRNDRSRSAESLLAQSERWGETAPTPVAAGWAKLAMGEFCDELEQPDRAYTLLNEAAAVAEAEGAKDLLMAANSRLSSMYANRGDTTRAATVLQAMENTARQSANAEWLALWAYNRGVLERKLGQFPESIAFFERSADTARRGGDALQQARALNALGLVLARTGKFADALARHNEALDLAKHTGDQGEIARTYRMLGFLHRNLDDEELAAQNIREALTHLGPRDVREGIALRGELSRSLLKMGKTEEAAHYGEEASEAAMSLGSPPNKVNSFTALSDVRLAQGRIDDADLWSRRAAEQFNSVAIRDQVQIHANRTRVAAARGDLASALAKRVPPSKERANSATKCSNAARSMSCLMSSSLLATRWRRWLRAKLSSNSTRPLRSTWLGAASLFLKAAWPRSAPSHRAPCSPATTRFRRYASHASACSASP